MIGEKRKIGADGLVIPHLKIKAQAEEPKNYCYFFSLMYEFRFCR